MRSIRAGLVFGLADPASPVRLAVLDFAPYGGGVSGIAVYDVTEPRSPAFVQYA